MAGRARNREKNKSTTGTRRRKAGTMARTTKGESEKAKRKSEERKAGNGREEGHSIKKWIWGVVNQFRRGKC